PQPQTLGDECFNAGMPIMGDDQIGLSLARDIVDILPAVDPNRIARLFSEFRQQFSQQPAIFRGMYHGQANDGGLAHGLGISQTPSPKKSGYAGGQKNREQDRQPVSKGVTQLHKIPPA